MKAWLEGVWGEISYVFRCAGCDEEHRTIRQDLPLTPELRLGIKRLRPTVPEGWQMVGKKMYCPAHTILVFKGRGTGATIQRARAGKSKGREETRGSPHGHDTTEPAASDVEGCAHWGSHCDRENIV